MARNPRLRFIVTGPGFVDGQEPSYETADQALSRALTAALKHGETFYARDRISGEIHGHAERLGTGWVCQRR